MILLSSTYRQASHRPSAKAQEKDPENKLLWHFARRRLDAEELRDAMLAVAGGSIRKRGGPSVIVPIEPELVNCSTSPRNGRVDADPEAT